jgi:hypothetical protein
MKTMTPELADYYTINVLDLHQQVVLAKDSSNHGLAGEVPDEHEPNLVRHERGALPLNFGNVCLGHMPGARRAS